MFWRKLMAYHAFRFEIVIMSMMLVHNQILFLYRCIQQAGKIREVLSMGWHKSVGCAFLTQTYMRAGCLRNVILLYYSGYRVFKERISSDLWYENFKNIVHYDEMNCMAVQSETSISTMLNIVKVHTYVDLEITERYRAKKKKMSSLKESLVWRALFVISICNLNQKILRQEKLKKFFKSLVTPLKVILQVPAV